MATKRGNNDGSIRQRKNGKWEGRYTAPDGNQKSLYADTQAEVQRKIREILQQKDSDTYVEPSQMTVAQWLDIWFETYARPKQRNTTAATHQDSIRLHLKPALGKYLIQKLRIENVQQFINTQIAAGYAPATVHKQIEPLRAALIQAVKNQIIIRNPVSDISLPKKEQEEIKFLTFEEQRTLISHLPETSPGRGLHFILLTGLRASELCGLQWEDLQDNSIFIKRNAQRVRELDGNGKYILRLTPTKTKAGRRIIPLGEKAQTLLDTQKKAQLLERLRAGSAWTGEDSYIFTSAVGTPLDRNNLGRVLRASLDKAQLERRGIHALRHSFATNAVRSGMDTKTLSEIIGHTNVAFTIQLYVHSDMNTKRAAMEAMESAF